MLHTDKENNVGAGLVPARSEGRHEADPYDRNDAVGTGVPPVPGHENQIERRPSLDGGPMDEVPAFAGTTEKVPACAGTTDSRQAGTLVSTAFENSVAWAQLFTQKSSIAVTYGKNITRPESIETCDLVRVMNQIKSDQLLAKISKIRGTYYEYGNALRPGAKLFVEGMAEVLREKYQALKRTLPWFCMAVFKANASGPARRRLEHLSAITGLIIDIDHVVKSNNREALTCLLRDKIRDAHFIFGSPTDGVKIVFVFKQPIIVTDQNREQVLKDFRALYDHQAEEVSRLTGWTADRACSDPTRACFLSWDRSAVKRNAYIYAEKWKRENGLSSSSLTSGKQELATPCVEKENTNVGTGAPPVPGHENQIERRPSPDGGPLEEVPAFAGKTEKVPAFAGKTDVARAILPEKGTRTGLRKRAREKLSVPQREEVPACAGTTYSGQAGTHVSTEIRPDDGSGQINICPTGKTDFLKYRDLMSVFTRTDNVPLEVDKLPLFLREYLELADKVTDASQGAKLTAFLTVIASNIGNRVYMNNIGGRVFCNIWSIIIGPSSVSRKTTVLNLARSTMHSFEESLDKHSVKDFEKETIWLSNVTSAKLLSLLSINPNRLFYHNEISGFLAEISKNYNQGMKQKITEIYDGVNISNLNMERCERIKNPALSILAASTESWFYPQLGSKTEQLSGFMQRFIYCIISDINVQDLNFNWVDTSAYREQFYTYEEVYKLLRDLPLSFRLKAGDKALDYRNQIYKDRMIEIYGLHNDPIMSYYSRIYDGYWYKFCMIITLFKNIDVLASAYQTDSLPEFFESVLVTEETAREAMYLCDYYFNNTLPLMKMMSEQDKLAGERKLVEILANKFEGCAFHSDLMKYAHFDKKEMNSKIDTLIEMDVIKVETGLSRFGKPSKKYRLEPEIMKSLIK